MKFSVKRRVFVSGLVALPFAAAAQDGEWQAVLSRDLRFRLEMPKPVEQSTAPEIERGHAGARVAWAAKKDEELFDFDYVDNQAGWKRERDDKTVARDLSYGEAEKVLPRSKFKYTRDEAVVLQGWDGHAFEIEDPSNGHGVMMRTWVVRDRLYRMLVTHKGDMKTKAAAVRFLDSLKLAETKSP